MNIPPPTLKQARVIWFCLTVLAVVVLLFLAGLCVWCLGWLFHKLSGVLVPMIFALILAYILDPVVEYFQRKRVPRLWSVGLVFALVVLIFVAVVGSVVPDLWRESGKLIADLPKNAEVVRDKIDVFLNKNPLSKQLPASWRQTLQSAVSPPPTQSSNSIPSLTARTNEPSSITNDTNTVELSTGGNPSQPDAEAKAIVPGLTKALVIVAKWFRDQLEKFSTWAEFLIGFVLVPVYLFYFLLEKQAITTRWTDYLPLKPSRAKDETIFVLRAINDCLIVFFRGQVLVALCVGVLLTIGYLILGLNYAVLLGLVAAVLGIVPYLGTITSLILALTVAGVQFQDWTHPLLVLAIAGTVKLLEDFLISPRIIGERAGLHPLTIILAVMFGTTLLGGFVGALLAIPLTAALRTLMFRYIWIREHSDAKRVDTSQII